jgi:hypothetical protein
MREEVSLQNRREILQPMLPQYREVSSVKKKSKLPDAFYGNDWAPSEVHHVAPQPCEIG